MAQWSLDLSKYAEKQKVNIKDIFKTYVFKLYSEIVRKTPVDTGRARGNWNISVGQEDSSVNTKSKNAKYKNKEQVPNPNGDESFYISNNLEYITKLEYGGYPKSKDGTGKTAKTVNGFSIQAPNGMVGATLANNENIFKASVREVTNDRV